jgi:membrane protein DedA with SNARE-associated domain
MIGFVTEHGLPLLFAVVLVESFGVPLPGETALIAFAILASQGHYAIGAVIAVAAAAAIVGDNLGYWVVGRWGGIALLNRWTWLRRYSQRALGRAEGVMARHGGKTVFIGRFVSILRYTVAWLAGLTRMGPWRFLFWNAVGGVAWAASVGLVAYYGGQALADAIQRDGLYAAAGLAAVLIVVVAAIHLGRRRLEQRL